MSVESGFQMYRVTVTPADDEAVVVEMSANEVRDTYPHWNGRGGTLISRDGATVTIEALCTGASI